MLLGGLLPGPQAALGDAQAAVTSATESPWSIIIQTAWSLNSRVYFCGASVLSSLGVYTP
jgi:hypothetical protein